MRKKRKFLTSRIGIWAFALAVMLVTTIPYVMGWLSQGDDWRFTGFLFGVEDGNSYVAKMYAGRSGDWLFRSPYTSNPQRGVIAFIPYMVLGKLAFSPGSTHLQLVLLFHIFRLISGILMIVSTYEFICAFIKDPRLKRWALTVSVLGGGLGWILFILPEEIWQGWMPLSLYSPESFGFLSLFGLPHLAFSRAFLLLGFVVFLRDQTIKGRMTSGLLWVAMACFQPLSLLPVWAVLLVYGAITTAGNVLDGGMDKENLSDMLKVLIPLGMTFPLILYYGVSYRSDAYMVAWKSQSYVLAPKLFAYILAYGIFAYFIFKAFRRKVFIENKRYTILVAWLISLPVLISLPFRFQRRLAEGIWVVLVILACAGLSKTVSRDRRWWMGVFGLTFISPLLLWTGSIKAVLTPSQPLYRPEAEVNAFTALKPYTNGDEVVLASFQTGNALPAWVPARVVIGHRAETVNFSQVEKDVEKFFQANTANEERAVLLKKYDVDYIFWGPNERELGPWNPLKENYLSVIYREDPYYIFQVQNEFIKG